MIFLCWFWKHQWAQTAKDPYMICPRCGSYRELTQEEVLESEQSKEEA